MAHNAAPILAAVACVSNVERSTRPCESAGSSGDEFVGGVMPWGSLGLLAGGCAFTASGSGGGRDGGDNKRIPRERFRKQKKEARPESGKKIGKAGATSAVHETKVAVLDNGEHS